MHLCRRARASWRRRWRKAPYQHVLLPASAMPHHCTMCCRHTLDVVSGQIVNGRNATRRRGSRRELSWAGPAGAPLLLQRLYQLRVMAKGA